MSETEQKSKVVDVRTLPPPQRHSRILGIFEKLAPGETLLVVNDHEPVHLVHFLRHERPDFDFEHYKAYQRNPGEWIGVFTKTNKKKEGHEGNAEVASEVRSQVIITSFEKERAFDNSAFSPVPIFTTNDYRVILTYFKAGQFIPVHSPSIDLVFLVHTGNGEVVAGEKRQKIKPGDLIIVPRGTRRGIYAETDMEALHLVSPPPADKDHEEVARKLFSGTFE